MAVGSVAHFAGTWRLARAIQARVLPIRRIVRLAGSSLVARDC